jgi:hypothetical protein
MRAPLAVPGWLDEQLQTRPAGYGRVAWHMDDAYGHPEPGFLAMCSAQRPGQPNAPHDHGASWVVYGVYQGAIAQTKWRWVEPEHDWTAPELKPTERVVQGEGQVAFCLPGEIHTTQNVHAGRSLVFRLEAQRLDRVMRHREEAAEARSIVEGFEAIHGPIALFDSLMVLLQMVTEIAVRPVRDTVPKDVPDGTGVGIMAIGGDPVWDHTGDRPGRVEEHLGCCEISRVAQLYIY